MCFFCLPSGALTGYNPHKPKCNCDHSQNADRLTWAKAKTPSDLRTFTTSTNIYSYFFDRCLSGFDMMVMLGFPASEFVDNCLTPSAANVCVHTLFDLHVWKHPFL